MHETDDLDTSNFMEIIIVVQVEVQYNLISVAYAAFINYK